MILVLSVSLLLLQLTADQSQFFLSTVTPGVPRGDRRRATHPGECVDVAVGCWETTATAIAVSGLLIFST